MSKDIDEGIPVERKGRIWKVAKIAIQLEEMGVDFRISPNLFDKYNDIRTCKHEVMYGE